MNSSSSSSPALYIHDLSVSISPYLAERFFISILLNNQFLCSEIRSVPQLTMFLRPFSVSASSLSSMRGDPHGHRSSFLFTTRTAPSSASSLNYPFASSTASVIFSQRGSNKFVVSSSSEIVDAPLTGVLFQPFEELKKDAHVVPVSPHVSIARQGYSEECEAAINEQIKCVYIYIYIHIYFVCYLLFAYLSASSFVYIMKNAALFLLNF